MHDPYRIRRRELLGLAAAAGASRVMSPFVSLAAAEEAQLAARPVATAAGALAVGEQPLGLSQSRDGLLYVPRGYTPGKAVALAVLLHGAGRAAINMNWSYPLADELGVIIIAPESRGRTWDAIERNQGPDVEFIDAALKSVFARVRVNPARMAMGGFSDGASYALSLGLANGDLFTHVMALSPGFIPANPRRGKPHVWVSHGTEDRVLPIDATSRRITPRLKTEGYDLNYREFEGPHRVLPEIAREAFEWFAK